MVLCEDRGSPPRAGESRRVAHTRHIERRFVPNATPERHALEHLWRQVKGRGRAHRPTPASDAAADSACRYVRTMSRRERLRQAGV
jgi:hypothetical protein